MSIVLLYLSSLTLHPITYVPQNKHDYFTCIQNWLSLNQPIIMPLDLLRHNKPDKFIVSIYWYVWYTHGSIYCSNVSISYH